MQQYIQFVINNWALWGLFLIILALLFWFEMRNQVGGVRKVDPQQAVNLMNHDHGIVLDIRDKDAYKDGHIIEAINIPFEDLQAKSKKLQKYKTKPIIIICTQGQQSIKAGVQLKQQGFEQLYALSGGLTAWRNANMPLTNK